ncbi:MAG: N-acetylglucosamine kinase [Acutalibacteraceae bacterium]
MILGIDGGGSKTTAVLFTRDGQFVHRVQAGSINYYSNPLSKAREQLSQIVEQMMPYTQNGSFESAFIGMSALNCAATAQELHSFCDGILSAKALGMDSDLFIALEAMHTEPPCAVAICGTGSMAVAKGEDGRITHRGGFGFLLGDEGSGYAISLEAVRAAMRGAEGTAAPTALTKAAFHHFDAVDADALIGRFYDPPIRRQDVAAFLPAVCACAEEGDAVARSILQSQAQDFSETVLSLVRDMPKEIRIGLWGGVFCHAHFFRNIFMDCLAKQGYEKVALLDCPPEVGAVLAAMKQIGIRADDTLLQTIRATYSPQED